MGIHHDEGGWRDGIGICPSCDKKAKLNDVGSMDQDAWFCDACIKRYSVTKLRAVANAALASKSANKRRTTCLRCGTTLVPGISVGFMCHECNRAYKERFGSEVRWQ